MTRLSMKTGVWKVIRHSEKVYAQVLEGSNSKGLGSLASSKLWHTLEEFNALEALLQHLSTQKDL